ncbi:LLM class oxidoreductase [Flindersiella endophytica]
MTTRPFRFGAAAAFTSSGKEWLAIVRRVEQLGYDSLLMPDGLWMMSPFPGLSAAAAVTSSLHLGTHVLAAPLRSPAMIAHETETLDLLTDQRFELGLGTGRPDSAAEAEQLGRSFGSHRERVEQVAETIAAVKQRFTAGQRTVPKLLLAGVSRRVFELAAAEADSLALPAPFHHDEEGLAAKVAQLRAVAGSRFDELELAANVLVVGDGAVPEAMRPLVSSLPADSYTRLSGTPDQIADTLRRRRDRLGISYVTIAQPYLEAFAPVVDRLAGT